MFKRQQKNPLSLSPRLINFCNDVDLGMVCKANFSEKTYYVMRSFILQVHNEVLCVVSDEVFMNFLSW